MIPRSLVLVSALILLFAPANAPLRASNPTPGASIAVYFPIVEQPPAPLRVEVTRNGDTCDFFGCGYPYYYLVYGYVHTLTATPLYSVTVMLDVDWIPYEGSLFATEEPLAVALPALLPGQANPFGIVYTLGKGGIANVEVRVGSWSTTSTSGQVAHALTVVRWARTGSTVQGTVRNDSPHTLSAAQVVTSHPGCRWQAATLSSTSLAPGQEASFSVTPYCSAADLAIVGQGFAP